MHFGNGRTLRGRIECVYGRASEDQMGLYDIALYAPGFDIR